AHEDDAERAVVAGLRLVERMRGYASDAVQRWDVPDLRVRVGIETGLAVLGEVHAGSQTQYDASGDCLNTGARLEGAADAGGVLVGPVTHRLVSAAFEWGDPRPLTLKGKAEPVLARHALALRTDGLRRGDGPGSRLLGRERELASAQEIVAAVGSGAVRTVFVTGQAGIGKTRFIRELRSLFEAARPDRATPVWLEGTCLSYTLDEPYLPVRQVLRQALGIADSADVPRLLGLVLGLPSEAPGPSQELSAESLQQAVIDAVVELVAGLATRGPVAIALDDLHWADAASLRLAEGLIAGLSGVPVLLVLAMRPETDRGAWALRERVLERYPDRAGELRLSSLDRADERGLIADLVGDGTLPTELEAVLLGRAEGNPFYLRELLRSLQDTGAIFLSEGRWAFDPDIRVEVPETVERVVLARIDRLPPGDRDLLSSAAVIGREFDLALLGRIAGTGLSSGSLSNLTRLGLFEEAPGVGFRFSHPLIQETAYSSMLRRGRAELHGRAAAALEELAEDGALENHAVLARHHSAAGHPAEAVRYYRLAALASQRVVAMDEAISQISLAIGAAASLDPASARALLPELYLLRGGWSGRTGNYPGGADDLHQALDWARTLGDEPIEMRALNELGWLARVHDYEEAIGHHQQALRLAEKLDDPSAQVTALSRMSMIHLNGLRLDDGLELAQRALGIARATGQDQLLGTALDCLKLAALQLGHLDLLERTVAEIIEVQQRAGDLYLLQWGYIEGATVPLARGDLEQARERIAQAVEINRRFASDRIARALLLEASSWIDRAAGDPRAAVAAVEEALEAIAERPAPEWSAWLQASLGSHLIDQGRAAEAIAVLESALEHSEAIKSPNRAFRAASHLALARQLVGDHEGSRTALAHARRVLATMTAPPGGVFLDGYRSYLALARTCVGFGDKQSAHDLLGPLRAAAREHGWRQAGADAAALVDQR
ncbi:MAG: ATP-binding protein, partial [Marmoricola sp.]